MSTFTEAPISLNIQITTPQGFSGQITFRGDDWDKIKEAFLIEEKVLLQDGFKPQAIKTFGPKPQKQIEYVEGRVCPKCKEKLVYFESKGKKHIKCSASKYNWMTKKSTGCDFISWNDEENNSSKNTSEEFPDRITNAQKALLIKLKTEGRLTNDIDIESLSKKQANTIISSTLNK